MKKLALILVLLLRTGILPVLGEETENYCHDPASEAQWQHLLAENPKDYDLQALHALRIGLCLKVDQGILAVDEASAIFERARKALIEKREAETKRKETSPL